MSATRGGHIYGREGPGSATDGVIERGCKTSPNASSRPSPPFASVKASTNFTSDARRYPDATVWAAESELRGDRSAVGALPLRRAWQRFQKSVAGRPRNTRLGPRCEHRPIAARLHRCDGTASSQPVPPQVSGASRRQDTSVPQAGGNRMFHKCPLFSEHTCADFPVESNGKPGSNCSHIGPQGHEGATRAQPCGPHRFQQESPATAESFLQATQAKRSPTKMWLQDHIVWRQWWPGPRSS